MFLILKKSNALLLAPCFLLVASIFYLTKILPIYVGTSGYDMDPSYQYLFNGLMLIHGSVPEHIDHPGTPLQIWAGIIIIVRWLIELVTGSGLNVFDSVIAYPEIYLQAICGSLVLLNVFANYYLGKRIFASSNNIYLALFIQASIFEFPEFIPRAAYLGAESFLIFASMLLIGVLAPIIFQKDPAKIKFSNREVYFSGMISGFGLAVKLNFIPMLGLLFLLPGCSKIFKAFLVALASWFVFVSPIIGRLGGMFNWFISIAMHSGRHGEGLSQVVNTSEIYARVIQMFVSLPLLFTTLTILLGLLFVRLVNLSCSINCTQRFSKLLDLDIRTPFILVGVVLLQCGLVIKHPGFHYLLPVLPLAYIGIAYVIHNYIGFQKKLSIVAALFSALLGLSSSLHAYRDLSVSQQEQKSSLNLISQELDKYPDHLVLGAFRCNLPECAVTFGSQFASKLKVYFPSHLKNFGLFDIWGEKIILYKDGASTEVSVEQLNALILSGKPVFIATPVLYPQIEKKLDVQKIIQTPEQFLFKVLGGAQS